MHTLNSLAKTNKIAVRTVASVLKKAGIEGTVTTIGTRTITIYGDDAATAVELKAKQLWARRNELRALRTKPNKSDTAAMLREHSVKLDLLAAAVSKLIDMVGREQ